MKALMVILFVLAAISLVVALMCGAVKAMYAAIQAVRGFVCHEMVMRPKERYYRMGGTW